MTKIVLGQGTDLYWHKGNAKNITEKEYLQMCALKTGCLSRMSAKLAVILAGKNDELAEAMGKIAETIGIAFQIQDDILDIALTGEERKAFGKPFGNDIKEGKRTLMVIHALKKATEEDKKRLTEILNKHTDDLGEMKEAIRIIQRYNGVEHARETARKVMRETWNEANKLLPPSEAKNKLYQLVNYLIERKV